MKILPIVAKTPEKQKLDSPQRASPHKNHSQPQTPREWPQPHPKAASATPGKKSTLGAFLASTSPHPDQKNPEYGHLSRSA